MTDAKDLAQSLFLNALEIGNDGEREAYVEAECGDDRELRGEVEQLLDHAKRLGRFLNPDENGALPTVDLAITEKPGESIDSYKLLQKIGEGGFGVVYMAEQKQPVRRKVALKIIKLGMDTKEVVARFEAERQALALMDHPNIARVLDAGATETGRPYFVMELIKGKQLTEYCDQNELSTHERLELFVTVCNAVQHAHQRGVIHRDLKPSNVMVTLHDGHPVPKVIDFGVSKALSQQLTEKTLFTNYGQMVGTPQYMSPEQAEMSGLDIDTRSDVYSLGVLLYELLTGTTPLDGAELRKAGYAEMQRLIREVEPQKPSTRLSTMGGELTMIAKHRSADARNLGPSLRGDLDWIVMKSLSKERERRYGSASGFAEDVSRCLSDQPIEARPPSTLYRCRKWMRRNKVIAAFVSAIAIGLLVGVAGLTVGLLQAHEKQRVAEQQRQRAVDGEEKEEQARKELQQTAAELDEANHQLSVEGARLAFEKGNALVSAGNSQEGLLWLARALEQTPDDNQALEEAIRFQYATIAATLPVPLRIFAPGADERFDHIKVNRERDRLLAAVSGAREEIRVWSLVTGKLIATVPQDGPVTWCDFSVDGAKLFAVTQGVLKQYDVSSKAAVGISVKLPPQIRILEIRPDGKQALVGAREETEFRLRGGPFAPRSGAFTPRLLDLATGDLQPLLPRRAPRQTPRYTPDGKWVIMKQNDRLLGRGRYSFSLKRVHSDNGVLDEEWSIDNVSISAEISVSPDGGKLLVISPPITTEDASQGAMPTSLAAFRDEINVFDLETAKQEFVPIKTDLMSAAAALSSDGEHILTHSSTSGTDKSLSVWRSRTGHRVFGPLRLISSRERGGLQAGVTFVSGDNSFITVASQSAVQWRLPALRGEVDSGGSDANASYKPRRRFSTLDAAVMLADGHTVAGVVTDGRVNARPTESTWNSQARYWDLDQKFLPTGRITAVLKAERATVSPDGTAFVTAAKGRIHRWRLATGKAIGKPIRLEQSNVVRLQVSGNGKVLMCQTQRTGGNWRQVNRALAYYWAGANIRDGAGGVEVLTVHAGTPAERAGLEKGDFILYAADLPVQTMSGFIRQIADVGASPLPLVIRRGDTRLKLALTPAVKPKDVLRREFAQIGNGQLTFYSMETGERLNPLEIPIQGFPKSGPFRALGAAISPDGLTVVTSSRYDSQHFTLQLWDMKTGRPRGAATRSLGEGGQVLFSPDGTTLAVIGTAQIELWDTRRLSRPATRIRHPGWRIHSVAFSDDGSKLATAGGRPESVSVRFWDVATGRQIGSPIPVESPGAFGTRIVWERTGKRLALVRQAGSTWISLPQTWDGKKSEVTRAAAAMAGCWLDPRQGSIHPLESVDWRRRLPAIAVQDGTPQTKSTAGRASLPWQSPLKAAASAIEAEDLKAAEQSLEQVAATAPREAVISWLENEICRTRTRPLTGELLDWYCRQLLKHDEANYVANQRRVVGLLGERKLAEAEESYRKATENGQRELALEQFYILASEMDNEPKEQAATKEWLLDRLLRSKPTHTQSRLLRAVRHLGARRRAEAQLDLAQLSKQMTATELAEDLRFYAKQRISRYNSMRVRTATMIYREIVDLVPDNRDYWHELGFAHARIREWKEAEQALRKVIELDPKSSLTYLQIAAILAGNSDRTAYKKFCQDADAQFRNGDSLEQFRRLEVAVWAPDIVSDPDELVKDMRSQDGVSTPWYECGVGIAYYRAGQPQDAISWLTKVVEHSRSSQLIVARAQAGLALAYQQLGDIDKAQQQLDQARDQQRKHLARRSQDDLGNYWLDIRILDTLCEEAEGHLAQEEAETVHK